MEVQWIGVIFSFWLALGKFKELFNALKAFPDTSENPLFSLACLFLFLLPLAAAPSIVFSLAGWFLKGHGLGFKKHN